MARARLDAARRWLVTSVVATAAGWGGAAGVVVGVLLRASRSAGMSGRAGAHADHLAAVSAAMAVGAVLLWRSRHVWSREHVALWVEERVPALAYALVTASDPGSAALPEALARPIAAAPIGRTVRARAVPPPLVALGAFGVALAGATLASPFIRARTAAAGRAALRAAGVAIPSANPLAVLRVRVLPPAYAQARPSTLEDPSAVSALSGSVLTITGASGVPAMVTATVAGRTLRVRAARDGAWAAALVVGRVPGTLALTAGRHRRVLAVIPTPDHPPAVTLDAPAGDTVWLVAPAAPLPLAARATDDVALATGWFDYLVTTGSGETFRSRQGVLGRAAIVGRAGRLGATLPLAALHLGPGDVLSVRAVVVDANVVTGPDTAVSDTRTLRVARPDENDSVAVEGAPPPPVQGSLLSERMLLMAADSLRAARDHTPPAQYLRAAGRLGTDQGDLRKRVYDILYQQDESGAVNGVEGDDEALDPQLVIDRDLKAAYDAMWEAQRALIPGDLAAARPAMLRAIAALDRARRADRLYLRGRTPRLVVDVARVRLSAAEKGHASLATARTRADTVRGRAAAGFDAALDVASAGAGRFADALVRLQAGTARDAPPFAAAIGAAADAVRRGADPAPALARARVALFGAPVRGSARVPWTGPWTGASRGAATRGRRP